MTGGGVFTHLAEPPGPTIWEAALGLGANTGLARISEAQHGLPATAFDGAGASRTGEAWVRRSASVLLAVPSRVIPIEWNYLLNPGHPDMQQVLIGSPQPFRYDRRLLKR